MQSTRLNNPPKRMTVLCFFVDGGPVTTDFNGIIAVAMIERYELISL